jgi:BirA family biotin operon repressor/biotin-[acetyl-CoA-carboxylase] ligase
VIDAAENVLAALVGSPGGVSAAAVPEAAWRELRRRGHDIGRNGDAWVLRCAAQHFDPQTFAAACDGEIGRTFEVWERTASTNDLARAGAMNGAPDGALWFSETQTAGRGRQGRSWVCTPHAGLLASFLVRTPLDAAARPTLLPLAVGLGACEALQAVTGLPLRTKWPNDILLDGRKVAGILVEARHGVQSHAVVGLGLNVHAPAIEGPALPLATTLEAHAVLPRREVLLAAVLQGIERRIADWRAARFTRLVDAWTAVDGSVGCEIQVDTGAGLLQGHAAGITPVGLLRLRLANGAIRELAAGEVHLQ